MPLTKTLFSRMLVTYLSVILSLLLLMGITASNMFKNQYLQEEEQILFNEMRNVNTILEEKYIYVEKREEADKELRAIARSYDALIQIVDQKGTCRSIYDPISEEKWGMLAEDTAIKEDVDGHVYVSLSGIDIWPGASESAFLLNKGRQKKLTLQRSGRQKLSEQGTLVYDLVTEKSGVSTLTLVRAFMNGGKPDGAILMHLDMSIINSSITQVYVDMLLIGLMAIAAAVLAVYYLTTRITRPITDMNSIVQRYSKGSFDLRINDEGTDEVAQLAKSFNFMADALSSLEDTRRGFVANVSHELRSPLTSISGFLEAMKDGTIPRERHGEYMDIVIAEAKRMTNMVNNLLDLARIENGQTNMHPSVFDINELARRTVITFEARINAKRLNVTLQLMKPASFVEADQDQIGQVLRNLIDNAIKFSPEEGKLHIATTALNKNAILVSVADSGVGIPKEDLPHVFERFYKAEKAHTPSAQSGTGLGLSIARVIMSQHGQDINVESRPGEGTRFTFTLKRVEARRRNESKPEERIDIKGD